MVQRTYPITQARGRLSWTAALAVQLAARQQVENTRVRAAREARALAATVLEAVDQLDTERDPSERIHLQEQAREAAGTIVTLLAGTGARVPAPRRGVLDLDHAVEQLLTVLGLAERRLTGARHLGLELALIVRDGVDHLADVEPTAELEAVS